MDLRDFRFEEVMKRLDNLNKIDIDERFTNIEKLIAQFTWVCKDIQERFQYGIKIDVTEKADNLLSPLKEFLKIIRDECNSLRKFRQEMEEAFEHELNAEHITGCLKFMAKQLQELKEEVKGIKEKGIKKSIQLDVTMDGYEMVPKIIKEKDEFEEVPPSPEEAITKLLDTLSDREKKVLTHKYGLFGEKPKKYSEMAKYFNVGAGRISQIHKKAIRKCMHPTRAKIAKKITHLELRYDILGE